MTNNDFTDPNEARKAQAKQLAEWDNAYVDDNGNIQFRLKTKFRWGRHEGNELRDVYKVEPAYIEWCLKTVNAFAIYEQDLLNLYDIPVFNVHKLNMMCKNENENTVILDLSSFSRDSNGFLIGKGIDENKHELSTDYIQVNKEKISRGIDIRGYQKGIPTGKDNNFSAILPQIKGVRIKIKVHL